MCVTITFAVFSFVSWELVAKAFMLFHLTSSPTLHCESPVEAEGENTLAESPMLESRCQQACGLRDHSFWPCTS